MAKQKFRHEELEKCGPWGELRLIAERKVIERIKEIGGRTDSEGFDEALGALTGRDLLGIIASQTKEDKLIIPKLVRSSTEGTVAYDLMKLLKIDEKEGETARVLAATDRTGFVTARFVGSIEQITVGKKDEIQTTHKRKNDGSTELRTNSLQGLGHYQQEN